MAIESVDEMSIEMINDANVPVNCFLSEPDEDNSKWVWQAQNFMPRKKMIGDRWELEADTKEELLALINEKVIPLYEAALFNLKTFGENYYWEKKG